MKNQSVVLLNYVSSGKTSMARQLFQPRLGDAPIIPIETINKDEGQENALKADDFRKAMQVVDICQAEDKSIIIDVGVSNVEKFLAKMKMEKAFDDFDCFVVPVMPDDRIMKNTITLIDILADEHKVPAKKIWVLFNKADPAKSVQDQFSPIFNYHADEKKFTLRVDAVVHESEVFKNNGAMNLIDASKDETDLKAAMRAATTTEEKIEISNMRALRKMSVDAVAELDVVFKTLFK